MTLNIVVAMAEKTRSLDNTALPAFLSTLPGALSLRLTRYDGEPFDLGRFARERIFCPDTVMRSVPKRQAEYFFGRLCAREALLAARLPAPDVLSGPAREPIWPFNVIGSITHNICFAAAAVAPKAAFAGVGIDIETVPAPPALAALANNAISSAELKLLRSLSNQAPLPLLLTAVFSAKESFFKACYADVGHYFEFDVVAVKTVNLEEGVIELEQNVDLCPQLRAHMRHRIQIDRLTSDTVITLYCRPTPG